MTQGLGPVVFTMAGVRRGMRLSVAMVIGLTPFGLVCGITAQGVGLSWGENLLMSMLVFAGSAQLVVLSAWAHPAPVLAATLASLAVNARLALMGPVLSPWLDRLRGWRLWGSLGLMTDPTWGLVVQEMKAGRRDAAVLFGSGVASWMMWVSTTAAGWAIGSVVRPPPGHPVFFTVLAVFVAMLAGMWRGRGDLLPWMAAAGVAVGVSRLLPGNWYILLGALSGSLVGALRDRRGR